MRVYNISFQLDQIIGFVIGESSAFDEVGKDETDRPRDSCQTVDHDTGGVECILNKVDSLDEISGHVESISVLARNLQIERDLWFGVIQVNTFSRCQNCPDAML